MILFEDGDDHTRSESLSGLIGLDHRLQFMFVEGSATTVHFVVVFRYIQSRFVARDPFREKGLNEHRMLLYRYIS